MKEDFLHYVWKFQKFLHSRLKTVQVDSLQVIHVGFHNQHDGPDFSNAQIYIADLKWVGSVEIHLKSSDWYRHNHHKDEAYNNVILHVVWEDDIAVCRADGSLLPTLVLKENIPASLLENHKRTFSRTIDFIPCEANFNKVPSPLFQLWKERLFVARLEEKSQRIQSLLAATKNDWEAVLFLLLSRNFGLNINGEAFFEMAKSIPFKVIRKLQQDERALEALLLGQAGLLATAKSSVYGASLCEEFKYLQHKFSLPSSSVAVRFMRLRPQNFPTIRLVQLAQLYASSQQLFAKIFEAKTLSVQWMTKVGVSSFWKTHYTFDKVSKAREKKITSAFVDLLQVNTLILLYFCYQRSKGKDPNAKVFELMQAIKPEKNVVVEGFRALGVNANNALDTQSFLHLKKGYCELKKCLLCSVGVHLLNHPE